MNMYKWLEDIKTAPSKKTLPILSFPGTQIIGVGVRELVKSGEIQAKCMKAIADKYDTLASVTLMDLSVEAETFGSPVTYSDIEVPTVTTRIIEDEDEVDALRVPMVGEGRTSEYIKTVSEAKRLITDRPVFAGCIGPFSLAGRLLDMTEIMVLSMIEPDMVEKVLEKCTSFLVEYAKSLKAAGANGLIIAEPAAGLLSPNLNSTFSVPFVKRIVDAVQDENFIVIYHNCGNVIPLIDGILKIGAKALHFGNAIEIDKALALVPDTVMVLGNVSPAGQFKNGTPESITSDVQSILSKCSGYDNFILSSGCDIPVTSSFANIDAFFKAAQA